MGTLIALCLPTLQAGAATHTLTVAGAGTGSGSIVETAPNNNGINATYNGSTTTGDTVDALNTVSVTLAANPSSGSVATSWSGVTFTSGGGLGDESAKFTMPNAAATVTVTFKQATKIQVETAADGSGTVVGTQNVTSGSSVTVYAVARDASGTFLANVPAGSWSLTSINGGVAAGDLVPASDKKSATFTGKMVGAAVIHASKAGLTATDSGTITVTPGSLDHFAFVGVPATATAGTAITGITVTAQDANNNSQTSFGGTVAYSGTAGVTGTSGSFSSGQITGVSLTPTVAGSGLTIVATGGGKTGTATITTVNPGPTDHYSVTGGTSQYVGVAFSVTVTAKDQFNNTVTTDNSTVVTMSSSTGYALFDGNNDGIYDGNAKTLTSGTFTIAVKDNMAETVNITAADANGKTDTLTGVVVSANPPTGAYRSAATGNWNGSGTWQTWNGSSWVATSTAPSSTAPLITIQSGNTVTVNVSATAGRFVVEAGGTLMVNSTLTLNTSAAGVDLDVFGTVNGSASHTLNASGTLIVVESGGTLNTSSDASDLSVAGTLTVAGGTVTTASSKGITGSGTLNLNAGTVTIGSANQGDFKLTGALTMTAGTLFVGHHWTAPTTTSLTGGTIQLADAEAGAQNLPAVSYYNLEFFNNSTSWQLSANTTVKGNLAIDSGAKLNLNSHNANVNTFTVGSTTVAAGTYTSASQATSAYLTGNGNVFASAGAANKLAFTTSAVTLTAGATSGAITVQLQDVSGNPITNGTTTVNLSTTSSHGTFLSTDGMTVITGTNIQPGVSIASFLYRDTASGTPTITAASGSLTSANQQETVNPAAASKLVFTSSAVSVTAGVASGNIRVQRQDQYGNPNTTDAAITLTMSSTSGGTVTFNPSSPQIATGASGVNFTYTDTQAGTPTIKAHSGSLTDGTQQETVGKVTPNIAGVSSPSITYGTNSITLNGTVSASGGVYPANGESGTISATINGHTVAGSFTNNTGGFSINYNDASLATDGHGGSPYTVNYSYSGDSNLSSANDTSTALTVNAAPLTITANNDTKTYGQTKSYGPSSAAFSSSGLQNGETIGTVTISASGGTAASDPVGGYNLTPSVATGGSFSAANYTITYKNGTLTVAPLPVHLIGNRAYDGTTTAAAGILSVANKVGSDDVAVASGAGTLAGANVGDQALTSCGTLALGGAAANNYTLTGASGSVTITAANTTTTVSSSLNPAQPSDSITFTANVAATGAGSAVPTGTVQFQSNGTNNGAPVTLSGGQASLTVPASSLGHGSNAITAVYANSDGNFVTGSSGTLSPAQVINTPPYAAPVYLTTTTDTPLTVPAAGVAAGGYDPDGDALTVASVDATSAHHGSALLSGANLIYTPPAAFAGNDTFSYVLQDSLGGTSTNTITVGVSLDKFTCRINNTSVQSDGTHLIGYGIPNKGYNIQSSPDLNQWATLGSTTADGNGLILFTDPQKTGTRYYRFEMQ